MAKSSDKEESISNNISKIMKKKYSSYYQGTAPKLNRIDSGLLGLDRILGGGLPCGRIIELFSDPSAGKTTTAQFFMKHLISRGYNVGYLDLERTVDEERLKELGLGGELFHYSRPDNGTQAMELLIDSIELGMKMVVVDSVPFLGTDAYYDSDLGAQVMAPQAVLLSRVQHRIVPVIEQNDAIVIFINQIRSNIGKYGNPKDSSGGNALKFMCSVRLRLSRAETAQDGSGFTIKFKTEKNKTGPEKKTCLVQLNYNTGLSPMSSLRDAMEELDLLYNKASWYYFTKELTDYLGLESSQICQGKHNVDKFISDNPEIYSKLYEYVLKY